MSETVAWTLLERWAPLVVGALLAGLAIIVIVGWHAGLDTLTRIRPDSASMKYNTALGFLLLGGSNLACAARRPRPAQCLAAASVILGFLTLFEYVAGLPLGLDTLFWKTDDRVGPGLSLLAGRMAPNTALVFVLAGAGTLLAARPVTRHRHIIVGCLGALSLAIAVVPTVGYATGLHRAHAWGPFVSMAMHTGTAFLLQGLMLIAISASWARAEGRADHGLLFPAGVALGTSVLLLWLALDAQHEDSSRRALNDALVVVRANAISQLEAQSKGLRRMAQRWQSRGGTPEAEWLADGASYRQDFLYRSIIWLDRALIPRWQVPEQSTVVPLPFSDMRLQRELALVRDEKQERAVVTNPAPGGRLLLLVQPVFVSERFDGILIAVIDVAPFFSALIRSEISAGYAVQVSAGAEQIFVEMAAPTIESYVHPTTFTIGGVQFGIAIAPTSESRRQNRSRLGAIAVIVGSILTVLTILSLYHASVSRARARDLLKQWRTLDEQKKELVRSNSDLEWFAHVAAHDLKSPLRAIANLAQWLEEDLGTHMSQENKEQMALLRGRVSRLDTLLSDLLRYSTTGGSIHTIESVDVAALVKTIFQCCHREGFQLEMSPGMPTLLTARAPLEQVFVSLIENALKHHDGSAGTVRIGVQERGEFYELTVCDDGPGIDSQHATKIFEPFQTLRPRDAIEGSGMGLAIAQRLLDAVGGSIRLDKCDGRGACFRFSWPMAMPLAGQKT